MSDPVADLRTAERDAKAARERLTATTAELRARLEPRVLAQSAVKEISAAKDAAARAGIAGLRRRPALIAGTLTVAGLLLARRRIAALFKRDRATRRKRAS